MAHKSNTKTEGWMLKLTKKEDNENSNICKEVGISKQDYLWIILTHFKYNILPRHSSLKSFISGFINGFYSHIQNIETKHKLLKIEEDLKGGENDGTNTEKP